MTELCKKIWRNGEFESELGPITAMLAGGHAELEIERGDADRAEATLAGVRAWYVELLGEDSFEVASLDVRLGEAADARGDGALAIARSQAALATIERHRGKNDAALAEPLQLLGARLLQEGRSGEARALLRRAIAIGERAEVAPAALAKPRFDLARATVDDDRTAAIELAGRAVTDLATAPFQDAPLIAELEAWLAANPAG